MIHCLLTYCCFIRSKREYEIERTRLVKNADGTESHMTFKIVTDHAETYLIVRIGAWQHTHTFTIPAPIDSPTLCWIAVL